MARIIFHFGQSLEITILRYRHWTQVYQKSWSYAILLLRYMVRDGCNYFSFWANFCPFTPLTAQNNNNSNKTTWIYDHFTQMYQKSWSYAILFLRYMMHDGYNCYFSFSASFCPFTALAAGQVKFQNHEKKNKPWRYHHFTQVYQKSWSCFTVPWTWCVTDVIIFHFGLFFAQLLP